MKKIFSILALLFGLLPCMSLTAYAASVSYVDGNGTSQTVDATELESTTTSWTDGSWYIVPEGGLTISGRIAVSGTVNLILRDGAELTASEGITTTGATLNIYAQSTGTGALTATGNNGGEPNGGGSAGIGGNGVARLVSGGAGGTVNIYGGTVTATGGNGAQYGGGGAGIGGGGLGFKSSGGQGGTVNIYGGTVTATGGNGAQYGGGGAGIGGGGNGYSTSSGGQGGTVNIYGSTVTATGGNGGQLAGGGVGIGGGGNGLASSAGADGTLTLGVGVKLYNGTDNTGTVLDDNDSESRNYSGSRPKNMFAEVTVSNPTVTANEGATGEYWATYYNGTTSFTADENTTVFQAALSGSSLTLTEVPNREIPATKAVILKSSSATITLTPATTTATLEGNALQGTATELTNPGNAYVLNKKNGVVGFYKLSSTGTIGANKAYLTYSSGAAPSFFGFDGNTTGIDATLVNSEKVNSVVYDLQGRRVSQPTKGLYIVNGKKVVIK